MFRHILRGFFVKLAFSLKVSLLRFRSNPNTQKGTIVVVPKGAIIPLQPVRDPKVIFHYENLFSLHRTSTSQFGCSSIGIGRTYDLFPVVLLHYKQILNSNRRPSLGCLFSITCSPAQLKKCVSLSSQSRFFITVTRFGPETYNL